MAILGYKREERIPRSCVVITRRRDSHAVARGISTILCRENLTALLRRRRRRVEGDSRGAARQSRDWQESYYRRVSECASSLLCLSAETWPHTHTNTIALWWMFFNCTSNTTCIISISIYIYDTIRPCVTIIVSLLLLLLFVG